MTITEELNFHCPPATAFDLMADIRNETQWNDGVSKAELTTDEPIGHGSRFVTDHGRPLGQIESTITVFDRAERLEFAAISKRMDLAISFTFTEVASGTLVHGAFDPKPKGIMDLRGEASKRRSKGHNLHNTWICVQDPLRRHTNSRMSKPSFSSRSSTKIQFDDITRGQHRANQPLRRSNPEQDQPRSDPDEPTHCESLQRRHSFRAPHGRQPVQDALRSHLCCVRARMDY